VSSGDREAVVVADVRPAGRRLGSERFAVTADGAALPVHAAPLISDRSAIAVVVDSSAAGVDDTARGRGGVANFLLQMPGAALTAVVADSTPPRVLSPLAFGPSAALRALTESPPRGDRATSDALTVALRELAGVTRQPRVVVLYTGASDAGGEPAAALAARLTDVHAVLAVVTTADADAAYWSSVARATGGVVAREQTGGAFAAFDSIARELRGRYLLTFTPPHTLPTAVSLSVRLTGSTVTAAAVLTDITTLAPKTGTPANDGGVDVNWLLALLLIMVLAAAALAVLARHNARRVNQRRPAVSPLLLRADERWAQTDAEIASRSRQVDVTGGAPAPTQPRQIDLTAAEAPALLVPGRPAVREVAGATAKSSMPAKTPASMPAKAPVTTPAKTPVTTPAKTPVTTPMPANGPTPARPPTPVPASTPLAAKPAPAKATTPAAVPTPAKAPTAAAAPSPARSLARPPSPNGPGRPVAPTSDAQRQARAVAAAARRAAQAASGRGRRTGPPEPGTPAKG
jgi:hypothetical protein